MFVYYTTLRGSVHLDHSYWFLLVRFLFCLYPGVINYWVGYEQSFSFLAARIRQCDLTRTTIKRRTAGIQGTNNRRLVGLFLPSSQVSIFRRGQSTSGLNDFRVVLYLFFKTSLCAKPLIWKWVDENKPISGTHFPMCGFAGRLVLTQQLQATRNHGLLNVAAWERDAQEQSSFISRSIKNRRLRRMICVAC